MNAERPEPDAIHVRGLRLWAHVGVLEAERQLGQWFELEFSLWADLAAAGGSDDLSLSYDYAQAIAALQALAAALRCLTLEHFAERALDELERLYGPPAPAGAGDQVPRSGEWFRWQGGGGALPPGGALMEPAAPGSAAPPLVLVHGLWDSPQLFRQLVESLNGRRDPLLMPHLLHRLGATPILELAETLGQAIEAAFGAEQPVDLLGFSMGE
ncbi:dihydroneopterin aldolase [Cyanobium sp. ATX-6F1]|uniref:dihydroneopterin aldolase n=1 Tax=Cyanobium sp. ATX-6F1 TaxID=3137388 RepID=UPI0039BDF627